METNMAFEGIEEGYRFEGIEEGYRVYKNADGFMEGYKSTGGGKKDGPTDIKRIISNQTTLGGFGKYVRGLRSKRKPKEAPLPSLLKEE